MASRFFAVTPILLVSIAALQSEAFTNRKSDMVNHGTVNIVLGNANGIVILTDSMITAGDRQLPDPAQKLFRLDDHRVCAIAGFVSAGWPMKDLFLTTSGIVKRYEEKLKSQLPQSIE